MTSRVFAAGPLCLLLTTSFWAGGCGGSAQDSQGDGDSSTAAGGTAAGGSSSEGAGGDAPTGGSASGGASSGGSSMSTGGSSSGGANPGGTGGDVGTGGGDSSSGGQGLGGADGCSGQMTDGHLAGAAKSSGFAGTDQQYAELYQQLCSVDSECIEPCTERGGTTEFCSSSVCQDSTEDYCLPPTKWRNAGGALMPSGLTDDAAVTSLSLSNGDDHDLLLTSDFGFDVPADAEIVGVLVTVSKAKASFADATDHAVRLIRAGELTGEDRGTADEWPTELSEFEYGSGGDLWGTTLTPQEVNAPDFGVAIGARPGDGGGYAYIDAVSMTVFYDLACP